MAKNVLGTELEPCCFSPLTGWHRDGYCNTDFDDIGSHTMCIEINQDFLEFSKQSGNNLSTPHPQYGFSGLQPGDFWCLCASRWKEAFDTGHAPRIKIQSCHEDILKYVTLEELLPYIIETEKKK